MPAPKPLETESKKVYMTRAFPALRTEIPDQEERTTALEAEWSSHLRILAAAGKEPPKDEPKPKPKPTIHAEQRQVFRAQMSSLVRTEKMDGTTYLVAPVIMITEGVHNAILYTEDELKKFPAAWNGRPLVVNHPTEDGKPVSANDPAIVEGQTIGQIFNASFGGDKKLRAEAWINPAKANEVDPAVMGTLQADDGILEVSVGVFEDDEVTEGVWPATSEEYEFIAHNLRPDHLAVLPSGQGACSVADGAGLPRVNSAKDGEGAGPLGKIKALALKLATMAGFRVNEMSHEDISRALRDLVRGSVGENGYAWVRDVYESTFVWEEEKEGQQPRLFEQAYMIEADGSVKLGDVKQEVREERRYVPIGNQATALRNEPESKPAQGKPDGDPEPKESKGVHAMKELVQKLVDHAGTSFTADDAGALEALSDERLQAIMDLAEKAAKPPEKPTADPKPPQIQSQVPTALTAEQVAEIAAKAATEAVTGALRTQRTDPLIKALVDSDKCSLDEDSLRAMSEGNLTTLAKDLGVGGPGTQMFFAGRGLPRTLSEDDKPAAMPPVVLAKKKEAVA